MNKKIKQLFDEFCNECEKENLSAFLLASDPKSPTADVFMGPNHNEVVNLLENGLMKDEVRTVILSALDSLIIRHKKDTPSHVNT